MTVFLVSYDLRKENPVNWPTAYKPLWDALSRFAHAKPMESLWLLEFPSTNAINVYNHFRPFIDDNDRLFVSEVNRNWAGWLDKDVISWLQRRGL